MKVITFDRSAKNFILDTFDKKVDGDGYIVEKSTNNKVIANDAQEIKVTQFGGIKKGSEIYIKSDIISVIRLLDSLK
ncbi:MAG: hypothetical protein AAB929_01170 [Patescibacteria group bacterium]